MNTCLKNWLSPQTGFYCLFVGLILSLPIFSNAQCFQNPDGQYVTANGAPCSNTIITAVPFLRIAPDARSAGMGDAGIATTTDASALHFNASKLAFTENRTGFGLRIFYRTFNQRQSKILNNRIRLYLQICNL